MDMINEVWEKIFKNKESVDTLGGTDNVRVTVLSYKCKFPNCLNFCEFEKKRGSSNPLKHLLTHWTPEKFINLVSQMKREDNVIITDYLVPEKDIELRKWFRMIILKNNLISIVQDKIYRDFAGFKHHTSIGARKK